MDASHAFKAHGPGCFAPVQQAGGIADVAKDGVDSLHVGSMGGVNDAHTGVERFGSPRSLSDAKVSGVIFQADSKRDNVIRSCGNCKSVFHTERGLQDRHKPDRSCGMASSDDRLDHYHNVRYLLWGLDLRYQDKIGRL